MNKSTKLMRSLLLVGLIIVGAILLYRIFAGDKTPDVPEIDTTENAAVLAAPVTGTWDYTVQADSGPINGVLLFAGTGGALTGTMANQNGTDPLKNIQYNAPKLTFSLEGGDGKQINFSTIVTGNTLTGTMNIPDMAPLRIEAKKQE